MPRGRTPASDRPLTGAERQARYRGVHAGQPVIRQRADRRSRPQRWRDAVAELLVLQVEYAARLDKLPEATQGLGDRRGPASHCRSRRTERYRTASRLWPRLTPPMKATRQWLHPLHPCLTGQPTRDITPTTRWETHPGRLQIGMMAPFKSEYPAGFIGIRTAARDDRICRAARDGAGGREPDRRRTRRAQPRADQPPQWLPRSRLGDPSGHQSQLSRLCSEIDDKIGVFLDRPLEGDWPFCGSKRPM